MPRVPDSWSNHSNRESGLAMGFVVAFVLMREAEASRGRLLSR